VKLTTKQIKQLIKEELDSVLSEGPLDKFFRRRKIKKQGGHEWDDFSSEQKDALRRAMDLEDPDMTKADLEFAKKQAREKLQADLETFKQERDAKRKAEEARRKEEERKAEEARRNRELWWGEVAPLAGANLVVLTAFIAAVAAQNGAPFFNKEIDYEKQLTQQRNAEWHRSQEGREYRERLRQQAYDSDVAYKVSQMTEEAIYETIKSVRPKHGKPIPKLYTKSFAEHISVMSVTEIEQVLKDELTIKKAFKEFEINPAEDLKIKKDDSIYK
jgi:hypothetical protein